MWTPFTQKIDGRRTSLPCPYLRWQQSGRRGSCVTVTAADVELVPIYLLPDQHSNNDLTGDI